MKTKKKSKPSKKESLKRKNDYENAWILMNDASSVFLKSALLFTNEYGREVDFCTSADVASQVRSFLQQTCPRKVEIHNIREKTLFFGTFPT